MFDLDYTTLQIHHATLEKLRDCRGARECTLRTRPAEEPGETKGGARGCTGRGQGVYPTYETC